MIMTHCAAGQARIAAATDEVRILPGKRLMLVSAVVAAWFATSVSFTSAGTTSDAGWVRVASSPDVQVFVDAGSVAIDSRGFIRVWTKTLYASPQTAAGIQYATDMTLFVLDCAGARYGLAGGKFLDADGNVLGQFKEPPGELQPIPAATKIDAVAKAVCTAGGDVPQDR
ncbi:surface-adhesin E family protein [Paraburkholderia xenovorans]